jgi:dTDP-4-dehydrorhamnose 3,5-epimerase-like enzyme
MIKYEIRKLDIHSDERGWVTEILRREHLENKKFGQIYVSVSNPGKVKANHYHQRKAEWFCVIKGRAKLLLKNLGEEKIEEITLTDDNLITVKIPPRVVHAIKNIGNDLMYLLAYTTEPYNPKDPDTFNDESITV